MKQLGYFADYDLGVVVVGRRDLLGGGCRSGGVGDPGTGHALGEPWVPATPVALLHRVRDAMGLEDVAAPALGAGSVAPGALRLAQVRLRLSQWYRLGHRLGLLYGLLRDERGGRRPVTHGGLRAWLRGCGRGAQCLLPETHCEPSPTISKNPISTRLAMIAVTPDVSTRLYEVSIRER